MSSIPLFPRSFRAVGLVLLVPGIVLGVMVLYQEFYFSFLTIQNFHRHAIDFGTRDENFTNELAAAMNLIALLFIAFSRYKIEDEYINQLRLKALYLAVWANYLLLLIAIFLIYGGDFWTLTLYNIYTILIIYIVTFYYLSYKMNRA